MKNLKLWQKLGILGGVFAIPFALVTWKLIATNAATVKGSATLQTAGAELYPPLLAVLRQLQHHRDLTEAAEQGDNFFREGLARKAAELEEALKAAGAACARADDALKTATRWRAVEQKCLQAVRASGVSAEEKYNLHTSALGEVVGLIQFAGDASGLNQDPARERVYLMEVIGDKGMEAAARLSRVRAIGAVVAIRKQPLSDAEAGFLAENARELERLLGTDDSSLGRTADKAIALNPVILNRLREPRQALEKDARASLAALQSFERTRNVAGTAAEHFEQMTRAMDTIYLVRERAVAALLDLFAEDLARFRWDVLKTLLQALVVLLIAGLIAWFIIRDITRPLEEIAEVADKVAAGNLAVSIPFENRRDEIGGLISAFNGMIFSLTSIVAQVQKSGLQVNTSINQISVTGREQQAAANQIAATTREIGGTAAEISNTSSELLAMMNDAFAVAEDTTELAGKGQAGLNRMRETMTQINEAASLIHSKLDVLNQKAANISQVVTTITKIADRTNLLSLNAAIEAEKAGEYGRGFSVVATEIRRLADQTAVATYDIEQTVKEMQEAVSTGVLTMNRNTDEVKQGVADAQQISAQIDQIILQVQALTPRFELVNQGMDSQATGGQQINDGLTQLSRTVQQTARSLEQSNEAIEQLKNAAYGLRDGVARFKLPR